MRSLVKMSSAVALCATIAASLIPVQSFAAILSVTDKPSISLSSAAYPADWRPYPDRHHHWQVGCWPASGIETHSATSLAESQAYPAGCVAAYRRCGGCGTYAAAYPTCGACTCIRADGGLSRCGGCGAWGYAKP